MAVENHHERLAATGVNFGVISPRTPNGERYVSARVYRLHTPGTPITNGQNLPENVGHIGPWFLQSESTETKQPEIGEGYMGPEPAVTAYIHAHYSIKPETVTYTEVTPSR